MRSLPGVKGAKQNKSMNRKKIGVVEEVRVASSVPRRLYAETGGGVHQRLAGAAPLEPK